MVQCLTLRLIVITQAALGQCTQLQRIIRTRTRMYMILIYLERRCRPTRRMCPRRLRFLVEPLYGVSHLYKEAGQEEGGCRFEWKRKAWMKSTLDRLTCVNEKVHLEIGIDHGLVPTSLHMAPRVRAREKPRRTWRNHVLNLNLRCRDEAGLPPELKLPDLLSAHNHLRTPSLTVVIRVLPSLLLVAQDAGLE